MLKKILIVLAVIVIIFIGLAAMQPSEFRVVRSGVIPAPAPEVFEQVNNFHNWEAWSPWVGIDPAMKQTYEGPPAGTGAIYKWSGNSEVGEGVMTITESHPYDLVRIRLDFIKPFTTTNTAEFTFEPKGEQTMVTWSMEGKNNFIAKAISMFIDMDKMVGGNFEKGLANLKTITASAAGN